jgi:hypothetical protein
MRRHTLQLHPPTLSAHVPTSSAHPHHDPPSHSHTTHPPAPYPSGSKLSVPALLQRPELQHHYRKVHKGVKQVVLALTEDPIPESAEAEVGAAAAWRGGGFCRPGLVPPRPPATSGAPWVGVLWTPWAGMGRGAERCLCSARLGCRPRRDLRGRGMESLA